MSTMVPGDLIYIDDRGASGVDPVTGFTTYPVTEANTSGVVQAVYGPWVQSTRSGFHQVDADLIYFRERYDPILGVTGQDVVKLKPDGSDGGPIVLSESMNTPDFLNIDHVVNFWGFGSIWLSSDNAGNIYVIAFQNYSSDFFSPDFRMRVRRFDGQTGATLATYECFLLNTVTGGAWDLFGRGISNQVSADVNFDGSKCYFTAGTTLWSFPLVATPTATLLVRTIGRQEIVTFTPIQHDALGHNTNDGFLRGLRCSPVDDSVWVPYQREEQDQVPYRQILLQQVEVAPITLGPGAAYDVVFNYHAAEGTLDSSDLNWDRAIPALPSTSVGPTGDPHETTLWGETWLIPWDMAGAVDGSWPGDISLTCEVVGAQPDNDPFNSVFGGGVTNPHTNTTTHGGSIFSADSYRLGNGNTSLGLRLTNNDLTRSITIGALIHGGDNDGLYSYGIVLWDSGADWEFARYTTRVHRYDGTGSLVSDTLIRQDVGDVGGANDPSLELRSTAIAVDRDGSDIWLFLSNGQRTSPAQVPVESIYNGGQVDSHAQLTELYHGGVRVSADYFHGQVGSSNLWVYRSSPPRFPGLSRFDPTTFGQDFFVRT